MPARDDGLAVYIHWPFCTTVCPYCDFNVHAARGIDQDAWRRVLLDDLAHVASETPGRTVHSIYFGGGTPSLMPPETAAGLIDAVAKHWPLAQDVEITLECNPTDTERERLADFKTAGVNRLSIGVQSFDDRVLAFLGRDHSGADALAALDAAQSLFARVTFDLMYGLDGQSIDAWRDALAHALTLRPTHLSLYQLTIEHGTPFFRDTVAIADADTAADLYELTQEALASAGLPAYEVSNHARPGDESRHNLWCWRGGDYAGIGPGAHGRLTRDGETVATHQIHNPERWLAKVRSDGHGTAKRRPLSPDDRARERMMMGLRLTEGIDLDDVSEAIIDRDAVGRLVAGGLLQQENTRLATTASGRLTLNAVLAEILT